ncbi:MAG TPA: DNA polymerase III subunit gamma/tau [Rhodocyclaceae bacterium]|nr:MAG: DNA polymerase III, subunit gamma and tau [Betaproteobacteria bacterium CG2_30_68_42]PIX75421.1 MAG: DNA polymerase III subunit gamma/tau [Rhodocyclales bacterium CG_4_10_14_3_um_filter_68_10]PJA56303.1 MAG: DNA polymerase III subunit gamma/tau [Rhodocyclales bacterium CG_4_9_14_3_um_filter_68_10]HCX33034.1 DNA polymerase III subunit gamma/tau [Rhodocyclaceae bacterium]
MSYQALARKWRPKSFETLVGQEHVVRALTHALDSGRLHHAYLFTGTRGVGKTTLARILAKALNCERGVSSRPCGECSSCREIDGGRFVDLLEVDAATNTRVDEMRALLDNAAYAPTRGRFKVYVIDEVHMLSTAAFNAMLKTLEEPPEHIKFILATTDPQKIPVTVLSRCLQFNLKQMSQSAIATHLAGILEAEGVACEAGALAHLAKAACGSMRDALSLLDQAIAHGAGRLAEADVRDMLGAVGEDHLYAVLDALAAGDLPGMLAVARAVEERSLSFDSALQDLASLLHRIALAALAPEAIADAGERARLVPYGARFDAEFLQLAYQIVIQGRGDLPLAPDDAAGFVMTLMRLFAFRPETPQGSAIVATCESKPAAAAAPAAAGARAAAGAPVGAAAASTECPWHELVERLELGGMVRELARHCALVELGAAAVRLRLAPAHRSLAINDSVREKLRARLRAHFGRPLELEIELGEPQAETPAERRSRQRRDRQARALEALEQDGFVREVIDVFDATLPESTIKPIETPRSPGR